MLKPVHVNCVLITVNASRNVKYYKNLLSDWQTGLVRLISPVSFLHSSHLSVHVVVTPVVKLLSRSIPWFFLSHSHIIQFKLRTRSWCYFHCTTTCIFFWFIQTAHSKYKFLNYISTKELDIKVNLNLFLVLTTSLFALHIYDLFNTPSLTTSRADITANNLSPLFSVFNKF